MSRVVIVSDCTDVAFAEMRGAIYSNLVGDADVTIEPLVPCDQFSVVNAAFCIRLMADAYPRDTVLCFIMNSLAERTERIVGRTKNGITFEGTNTGAVGWLLDDFGLEEVYELHDPGFVPFGGKYVHTPAIGKLVSGVDMRELGNPFDPKRVRRVERHDGLIVHVDNFGNGKFMFKKPEYQYGDLLDVTIGDQKIRAIFWKRMMERSDGEWVVYPGSSWDLLELGQVRGRGLRQFDIRSGAKIKIEPVAG